MHHFCYPMNPVIVVMKMKTQNFRLLSRYDGLGISVMAALPDVGKPVMALQLTHGMCGCKERFLPFMEYMASNGVACIANDLRGHGDSVISSGDLGYMYDGGSKALVSDMAQVTEWIHERFAGIPVFMLGHSMGSLAVRVYLRDHDRDIDGLVICGSPSWNPMARIGYALASLMESMGAGRKRPEFLSNAVSAIYNRRFSSEGRNAWTCSDPDVRKAFRDNPLCNFTFTVNGTKTLLSLMMDAYLSDGWKMSHADMPVIFLSGEDDPCMTSEARFHDAVRNMYNRGYHNISSAIYGGMRHEILNEKEKELVWQDILDFMKS